MSFIVCHTVPAVKPSRRHLIDRCTNAQGASSSQKARDDRNDCTVRATAAAFNITYEEASALLTRAGRKTHKGFNTYRMLKGGWSNPYGAWREVEGLGRKVKRVSKWNKTCVIDCTQRPRVRTFLEKYAEPGKRYIVIVHQHAMAVVDGKLRDNQDYLNCVVKLVFEITPNLHRPGAINLPVLRSNLHLLTPCQTNYL